MHAAMKDIVEFRREPTHTDICTTDCPLLQALNATVPLSNHNLGTTAMFHVFEHEFLKQLMPFSEYKILMQIVQPSFILNKQLSSPSHATTLMP